MRRYLLLLIFVLAFCFTSSAEARKLALLVGVNEYENIQSLKCCVNDMKILRQALIKIGFNPQNIHVLVTGSAFKYLPTKKKIEEKLKEILSMAQPNDLVLIAFSGHGAQNGKNVYFCPPDTDLDDLDGTCVSITKVMDDLAKCPAKFKWMVVDACRNDPASTRAAKGLQVVPAPPAGIALFQSCAKGELSYEERRAGGNGYFTKNFAAALSGEADANHDGRLTLFEVCDWTANHTKSDVQQAEKATQRPYFSGSIPNFILTEDLNVPEAKALVEEARKAMDAENYALAIKKFDEAIALCPKITSTIDTIERERDYAHKMMELLQNSNKLPSGSLKAGDRGVLKIKDKDVEFAFRYCPPGTFTMGSPESEKKRSSNETQYQVTLTKGFWIMETEVTQKQWIEIMGENPSHFRGENLPVEQVSWKECQDFCIKCCSLFGMSVQLPTEAQWEYACRAGSSTAYSWGNALNGDKANCYGNCPYGTKIKGKYPYKTMLVGSYSPNAWGLYDMHGNVEEWCADWYGVYPNGKVTNPVGPPAGSYRVYRGGSWKYCAQYCRSAYRYSKKENYKYYTLGFRCVIIPE
ncbi:MAG: SUMF1/EgtB/PvdO family nonheme iron enzyme [Thermoguttaceae bacterium]|nr:SUMF1/EgtB/PvdO family nonheme iron enzyme [Thermoguttaceae bacterium]